MDASRYKTRFEELLAETGVPLAELTPEMGFDVMLRFYREYPHGMMHCFWGGVTKYADDEVGFKFNHFGNISGTEGERDVSFNISLLFKFGPKELVGSFPSGARPDWFFKIDEIDAYRARTLSKPAFQALGRTPAPQVAFVWEDDRSTPHDLYDCWGARDPSRPVVCMNEQEWVQSDNVGRMLRWFRQEWQCEEADLNRLLQRFLLACCRRIWKLLPMEASRTGVEVSERHLDGQATREEISIADWNAEGACFGINFDSDPEAIARWCDEISQIPPDELAAMLQSPCPKDDLSPRGLLSHAAYFASSSMSYPGGEPKESIERYTLFLPPSFLREFVGNPFRPEPAK